MKKQEYLGYKGKLSKQPYQCTEEELYGSRPTFADFIQDRPDDIKIFVLRGNEFIPIPRLNS